MDGQRAADEWMRDNLSQRLAAIEVGQKLYHDELKSIMELQHKELETLKFEQSQLRWTLFGGPKQDDVGLLERIRVFMWKAGIATTVALGGMGFTLKLFSPSINKWALRLVGADPVTEYVHQSQKRKLQMFNRKTGEYEYYIEFTPVGNQGQKKRAGG